MSARASGLVDHPFGQAASGWPRRTRIASDLLMWIGAATCAAALTLGSPLYLAWSAAILSAGLVLQDVAQAPRGGITPITLYSLSACTIGVANAVGIASAETDERPLYFLYAADEHLLVAMQIMLVGGVLPVLVFRMVHRSPALRSFAALLPRVTGDLGDRHLVRNAVVLAALVHIVRLTRSLDWLGTIGSVFLLLPVFMVFILARLGAERRRNDLIVAALVIAFAEALRALMVAFLRVEILLPLVAFIFGALLGRRSFEPLRWRIFLPIYGALTVFVLYFGAFAQVRAASSGGLERLEAVQAYEEQQQAAAQPRQSQTVLSRLSTFNQLTQVRRIVEEDGFLRGETLEYLAFAFVPRIIWPEKPIIAKGQWFAGRIGQGFPTEGGGFSNSINMTVQGELYLNFGWPGVVFGGALFGALLAMLWMRAGFWTGSRNSLGAAFGFYLLWVGFGMGADVQILVTIIAVYGVFVVTSAVLSATANRKVTVTSASVPSRRPVSP